MMRYMRILPAALLFLPFEAFLGQDTPAKTSRITGSVVDSIRAVGLEGAEVMISGVSSTVTTDSLGRFAIGGLAPGVYEVGVFHPLIEALGLTLTTKPFELGRDSTGIANLAIPSAKTLARRYCGNELTPSRPAAIAGRVRDPDNDTPVSGATVSLAWVDIAVTGRTRLVQTPHLEYTQTDSTGFFKFCGLPGDLDGTVQVSRGGAATGEIGVTTAGNVLTFENLAIAAPRTAPLTGAVRGTVRSLDDKPLARARVEVRPTGLSDITGDDGTFSISAVPTGTQVIVVRHVGFAPLAVPVTVRSREPIELKVTLATIINVMDPVIVTARENYALEKRGFFERKRRGWGTYLTRDDIKKWHPQVMTDVLRDVPWIRIRREIGGTVVESGSNLFRPRCTSLYVDGIKWYLRMPGDMDAFVSMRDVAGIEVYRPGDAPVQFRGFDECGVILVWTQFQPR
jgi:carboxypeptidase family protein